VNGGKSGTEAKTTDAADPSLLQVESNPVEKKGEGGDKFQEVSGGRIRGNGRVQ
jgi:hypothetical protein